MSDMFKAQSAVRAAFPGAAMGVNPWVRAAFPGPLQGAPSQATGSSQPAPTSAASPLLQQQDMQRRRAATNGTTALRAGQTLAGNTYSGVKAGG